MVPIRQTLIEMGWKQPSSPIQTDNLTATGVVNKTIIQRKRKSTDLHFHFLRCRKSHWAPGHPNWGDYSTNSHPLIYHINNRPRFAGYVNFSKKNKNIYLILYYFSRVTARVYCFQYIIRLLPVTYTWNLGIKSQTRCQYCNTRNQDRMRCE